MVTRANAMRSLRITVPFWVITTSLMTTQFVKALFLGNKIFVCTLTCCPLGTHNHKGSGGLQRCTTGCLEPKVARDVDTKRRNPC
jgi:hypothetical protein